MARVSRREKRERRERWRYGTYIAVAVALVAALLAFFRYEQSKLRELDASTACPESPDSLTLLLIDVTDPMTRPQQRDYRNQLDRLAADVPRYGQLSVVRVDADVPDKIATVITRCNPGTAKDVDEGRGNPAGLQADHERRFKAPLNETFARIAQASPADTSPLFEAVQSVALSILKRPSLDGKARRLIIVSDLLQNTDRIDFYRALPTTEALLDSPAFKLVRTDLSGVSVELWMLQRPDATSTQPRALIDLWTDVLTDQGATVERAYNVSG